MVHVWERVFSLRKTSDFFRCLFSRDDERADGRFPGKIFSALIFAISASIFRKSENIAQKGVRSPRLESHCRITKWNFWEKQTHKEHETDHYDGMKNPWFRMCFFVNILRFFSGTLDFVEHYHVNNMDNMYQNAQISIYFQQIPASDLIHIPSSSRGEIIWYPK